jgi:hypothetical protein
VQALVAGGHLGALGTDPRLRRSDLIRSGSGRGPLLGLPGLEDADLVVQRGREQAPRLFAQPLDAPLPVLLLLFEVVDARALDLRRLRRLGCLVLETVPLGLPPLQGLFGLDEALADPALLGPQLVEAGPLRRKTRGDLGELQRVVLPVLPRLLEEMLRALQVVLRATPRLPRELDGLLEAGDLRAHRVEPALHRVEGLIGVRLLLARLLDVGLHPAQHGDGCLQPVLEAGERPPVAAQLVLERPPPQGQQLGTDLPLLALEHPVLLRGCGLALQVLELLADLVPQVAQAGEVLPRLRDPALGLAATLLVLRDARGLLQIDPEVLRPGLDESGDHPLLDDRVAAGAQTRTQEQVGDVAAAAAHAVEEVARLPVPGNLALHRDLPVLGVLAAGAAVGIVEDELDGGGPDRLAAGRAVEDDVGHGLAAQGLRGHLAHDPAHGVDHVGLAAAVRAHDPDEVARKLHRRGVHERLEPRELDPFQAHGAQRYRTDPCPQSHGEQRRYWKKYS